MSLRDRKRARTRQALLDAAVDLFERHGYDRTGVADIAAAAEVGTRTFFRYFPSKEALLFPEADDRIRAAVAAITDRAPDEEPTEVLLRALRTVTEHSEELGGRLTALRLRLIREVPAVRGRALQLQLDAQREIARHLAAAYPRRLDPVAAAALVGAFVGAVNGALDVLLDDPRRAVDPVAVQAATRRATEIALAGWSAAAPTR